MLGRIVWAVINKDTDPLSLLNSNVTVDPKIIEWAQSINGLLLIVGGGGAVITLMISALIFKLSKKNAEKFNEFKENIVFKLLLVFLLFGATFFCGIVKIVVDYLTDL